MMPSGDRCVVRGRRAIARALGWFALFVWTGAPLLAHAFALADVAARARQLVDAPYQRPAPNLPKELHTLDYERYWNIRYRADRAYWRGTKSPFEVTFFHQGLMYDLPVRVNEIAADEIREIKFDPEAFDYGSSKLDPKTLQALGFAGVRVRHAAGDQREDALMFLGASYFRGMGKGQYLGSYGRGLAIDTGLTSGEEFPRFVEFWIERPASAAQELVLYALLDSPSATGAFRFLVRPGVETVVDVATRIYLRKPVGKLGIAPIHSMFLFGSNQSGGTDDYRPQVHNADGLSIATAAGDWIWRPLVNPKRLLTTSFTLTNPAGFGLMQRARKFAEYEDLEARFDLRPSMWIEPRGQWGAGRIELVQVPLPDESNNNVFVYWVPEKQPAPKEPLDLEYRILWQKDDDVRPPHAWVAQTRGGNGYMRDPDDALGMLVDFEGPALKKLAADAKVDGAVWIESNGELLRHHTYRNAVTGGWRTVLRFRRLDASKPVELRAVLRNSGAVVSETWSYILPPG